MRATSVVHAGLLTTGLAAVLAVSLGGASPFSQVGAAALGANAIICVPYNANEVTAGVTEVLAYGTAVVVEPFAG
jgi:hypothetical protein